MSRITYIVVGENPLSGIFKSQMYGAYDELEDFDAIEVVFIINPVLYLRVLGQVRTLQNSYERIRIRMFPLQLFPERYMRLHVWLTILGNGWNLLVFRLLSLMGIIGSGVVCGRSYYAAYILDKIHFSVSATVFDPRSIYPLERYSHGYIKSKGVYEYWLSWEQRAIKNFDAVISVSRGMSEYYSMYNNCVHEIFLSSGMAPRTIPVNREISKNLYLVYWGSLVFEAHNNSWIHYRDQIDVIAKNFSVPVEIDFFVPKINNKIVENTINGTVKVNFFEGLNQMDIAKYHAAIYLLPVSMDSFSRLGIKTVEYLSQNLPIIFDDGMSQFVRELLTENKAGFDINLFDNESLKEVDDNPLKVYNEYFHLNSSKKNLRKLYESLGSESKR